ncbi:hypothetical protein [Gloeobacter kilaueensis]|uniref:Uncharacterized protein n=1 Tax=Gloeobacter kilaueensis (strain ATCC BAA-2537 / CCAP 1431/1 / ULC 316 / JS1) TaxID=1183438 RepID=U5QQU1_GLOK1|nr:hypothetical protein [Gloeobacter kilaueensis]AGY60070.1 hypothetical protein GKIL_3824 [Gloeobacter kilaueensis JS1]
MPVKIRRDLLYAILSHVQALEEEEVQPVPALSERDFTHLDATPAEIIGHIDYIYQKGMLVGDFEPGSYGDRRLERGGYNEAKQVGEAEEPDKLPPAPIPERERPRVEAAPDPRDNVPIVGAVDVDNVRLTAAGRAALAELERDGHAPERSNLS